MSKPSDLEVRDAIANTLVLFENYIYAIVDAAQSVEGDRLKQTSAERGLLVQHIMLLKAQSDDQR